MHIKNKLALSHFKPQQKRQLLTQWQGGVENQSTFQHITFRDKGPILRRYKAFQWTHSKHTFSMCFVRDQTTLSLTDINLKWTSFLGRAEHWYLYEQIWLHYVKLWHWAQSWPLQRHWRSIVYNSSHYTTNPVQIQCERQGNSEGSILPLQLQTSRNILADVTRDSHLQR